MGKGVPCVPFAVWLSCVGSLETGDPGPRPGLGRVIEMARGSGSGEAENLPKTRARVRRRNRPRLRLNLRWVEKGNSSLILG